MPTDPKYIHTLRRRVDKLLSEAPEKLTLASGMDLQKLVHELSVHQIELEMQNEELRRSQEQLEESRNKYAAFYDFAPVGFLTFDRMGIITEANLTACDFLGLERSLFVKKPFALFVRPESQNTFRFHQQRVLETTTTQTCQLVLKRRDGTFFDAQLVSIVTQVNGRPAVNSVVTDVTERKQAEKDTGKTRDRAREYLDIAGVLLMVLDENRTITLMNRRGHAILGYEEGELVGKDWITTCLPPEVRDDLTLVHQKLISGDIAPVEYYENSVVTKQGKRKIIAWHNTLLRDEAGNPIGTLSSGEDITDRKQFEEALRESETNLRVILDNSRDAIVANKNGIVTFANPALASLAGYGCADDLIGTPIVDFIAPESRASVAEIVKKRAAGEPVPSYHEATVLKKDGTTCLVETTASTYVLKGEQFTLVILRDITERKQAELKIAQFAAVVQSSQDAIFGTSLEGGVITSWNKGAEGMYGYRESEAVGSSVSILTPPEFADERRWIIEKIRAGEQLNNHETTRRKKDGQDFQVSLSISPIRDAEGRIVAISTVGRDVTEKKKLEAQLVHSRKLEAIGTLAGGVAHDFNNILMVIMSCADLIQAGIGIDDPLRPHVDQITTSSERAADLTRRLLEFSREESITLELHSLNDIVRGSANLLKRLLAGDIEITLDLTDADLVVNVDAGQVDQVLMNLATNARDAMARGGSLIIKTRVVTLGKAFHKTHGFGAPGRYVALSVSDSGTGMDKETIERIFDPFFTTKAMGKGTGLGLASVYGTVKQHGGYITVSSEPHKGTSFDLYFPLVDSHPQKGAVPQEIRKGTVTILIAEDDPDVRKVMAGILEQSGYVVIQAADGEDAIRLYEEHKDSVDLVILDVIMPHRNGREVLDEIARVRPRVKAMFVSGYPGDVVLSKGTENGPVDFVRKPVSGPNLLSKVREVLDR